MIERENSSGATLLPPHTFSQGGGGSGRLMQKVKRIKTHTQSITITITMNHTIIIHTNYL